MLLKHGMEIRSEKTLLDSDAQPEMYNGEVFRGSGPHLLFAEDWRLESNASSHRIATGVRGRSPQRTKILLFFLGKNN